jgi:hypothetical protein
MTVEQYKTKNLLKTEVHSTDVAKLAAELCRPLFAKTTGAQIPIEGEREINLISCSPSFNGL